MLHKDGSVKWFLSRGSAVRGADGALQRLVGTKVDITGRKRAAEQFRLAIEAAPAGMITVDRAGAIVLVNAQVERLFGYDRSELLGQAGRDAGAGPASRSARRAPARLRCAEGRQPGAHRSGGQPDGDAGG